MVVYLLGVTNLNYVGHRAFVRGASAAEIKYRERREIADLSRLKDLTGGQERHILHRATTNRAWISATPNCLNVMDFSREKFRDNICLRYGLMPHYISATCDGCGKKLLIDHTQSFPKGVIILVRHDDAENEWVALGS